MDSSTKIFSRRLNQDGFRISYLESPLDPVHLLKLSSYIDVWKQAPRQENGIWIINPFTFIPVRDQLPLRLPLMNSLSYRLCLPSIKPLLAKCGLKEPDLIWAARPGSGVLKRLFPMAKLVMQVVDYYPAFRGDYIKEIEKQDYASADCVVLIGNALMPYLVDELGISRHKIQVVGQGADISAYTPDLNVPEELLKLQRPLAVWVGVLNKGDAGLFETAASSLQTMGGSIALIGPCAGWSDELAARFGNVHTLGSIPHYDIPAYLQHADLGLMLYDRDKQSVYKGQNPLKLYEYAAAGLPIISTPHDEYTYINPPVIVVSSEQQVPEALNKAISEREKLSKEVRQFASQHSWDSAATKVRKIITGLLGD